MEEKENVDKVRKTFGITDILEIYPHRFPMLFVDEMSLMESGKCVGYKNVTINEIWFMGHFPGNPVLPGIVIIETLSQVGGMCFYDDYFTDVETEKYLGYIAGYSNVRFSRKAVPGDRLRFEAERTAKLGDICRIKGRVFRDRDGAQIASGEITYAFEKRR